MSAFTKKIFEHVNFHKEDILEYSKFHKEDILEYVSFHKEDILEYANFHKEDLLGYVNYHKKKKKTAELLGKELSEICEKRDSKWKKNTLKLQVLYN